MSLQTNLIVKTRLVKWSGPFLGYLTKCHSLRRPMVNLFAADPLAVEGGCLIHPVINQLVLHRSVVDYYYIAILATSRLVSQLSVPAGY